MFKLPSWVSNNALLFATLVGVGCGVALGFGLREVSVSDSVAQLIAYPGEIFTRSLQMMILPLVMSSLVVGSANGYLIGSAKTNGKIAVRTLSYFILTSLFNAILGVILVVLIRPGNTSIKDGDLDNEELEERKNTLLDNFLDLGRNIIPSNIFSALFQQTQTVYTESINHRTNQTEFIRTVVLRDGTNTLGVISFALMFGMVLGTQTDKRAVHLIDAFRMIDIVIMTIIRTVMWITPVGVGSLIASKILEVSDIGQVTSQLGMFMLTVIAGVFLYQLVILQLLYFIILRKNPFRFYIGLIQSTITAFATASAAVALPITFRCMENLKIDPRISQFVLPIGVTVNKDGTALFVSVASVFIAQMNGFDLDFGQLATVAIASTAVSIASASIPSAALALMFIVLNAIGVPTTDIGLLFAVDWLVDRIRTTNNALGDCYAAAIVEHFSQKELKIMDADLKLVNNNDQTITAAAKAIIDEESPPFQTEIPEHTKLNGIYSNKESLDNSTTPTSTNNKTT